jgi:hypothetical protein
MRRRKPGAEKTLKHTTNKIQSTTLVLMASNFTIMDGNGWHKRFFVPSDRNGRSSRALPLHVSDICH